MVQPAMLDNNYQPHSEYKGEHNQETEQAQTLYQCLPNHLHAGSAVNTEDLSVDPLTVLRGEEADDAGDVDRETDTVEGRPGAGELVHLVVRQVGAVGDVLSADGVVHVRLDPAGGDGVDGDLLVAKVCIVALVSLRNEDGMYGQVRGL